MRNNMVFIFSREVQRVAATEADVGEDAERPHVGCKAVVGDLQWGV